MKTPALDRILSAVSTEDLPGGNVYGYGCYGCPFSHEEDDRSYETNKTSKCLLLDKAITDMDPECELSHWQARAKLELKSIGGEVE